MTNKDVEAYDLFEKFVKHCESNNIIPQYIMMQYGTDHFWDSMHYFMNFNYKHENPETD